MKISISELENALFFTSSDSFGSAYLDRETGRIYYTSEMGDFEELEELPEDIFENARYLEIPHKNDLDLGRALVRHYAAEKMPQEFERVEAIFRKKGAYGRFKNLLEEKGLLDDWQGLEVD